MIAIALGSSVVLATCGLMAAYAIGALWVPAGTILVLGILWIAGCKRDWPLLGSLMLGLSTLAAAVGAWLGLRPVFLVVGLAAALSAWDLDHYWRELRNADVVERRRTLSWHHLRRVLIVDGISLLCAAVALRVRIELSFAAALLLGLIALVGLSHAMGSLRGGSDG